MSIEAMKQALETLEQHGTPLLNHEDAYSASLTALRQAIEQAEKQVSYSGNGTAGRENMTAPTGFFVQMPKAEAYEEPDSVIVLCFWKDRGQFKIKTSTASDRLVIIGALEEAKLKFQMDGYV